jgi:hypothetical protein
MKFEELGSLKEVTKGSEGPDYDDCSGGGSPAPEPDGGGDDPEGEE